MIIKCKKIVFSIALALGLNHNPGYGQGERDTALIDLNDNNGITINGVAAGDGSGGSVSGAGDFNGDGIDDVVIGAMAADPDGDSSAGSSYVVFGTDGGLPNPLNLVDLNGLDGIVINGANSFDDSGVSVSAAGDINGDGIDDVIIGAEGAEPNGNSDAGISYVVFGSVNPLPNPLNLYTINGINGFSIHGVDSNDQSGHSVSAAGDVNGDGIEDIIVGAFRADPDGNDQAGSSYVLFGSDGPFPNPFFLNTIDGSNGFVINGVAAGDNSGQSVSAAGDVNDDGIDDIIIGASRADPNGNNQAGISYVLFGSIAPPANPFNLSDLNGSNGFAINGVAAGDNSGASVSAAGDVNGDGIDDIIIGADGSSPGSNTEAGSSYVVFGTDGPIPSSINLSDLNGSNGFAINGVAEYDYSGTSVSAAGDVNGDGIDDIIIGASGADPNGHTEAGSSFVVFGTDGTITSPISLSDLTHSNGFSINAVAINDRLGTSVSAAGDVNGDGFDDIIIGAPGADPNGDSYAGSSYVVFGHDIIFKNSFE